MSYQTDTTIRLVKCPKCKLILPELPDMSVYKCGGCKTVLQAKHRKPDMKEVGFDYHETDKNGPKDTFISHVEESSAPITTQISDNSVSLGQNCFEYGDSSSQDIGQCGNVLGDGNKGRHQGTRVSGFPTSMELTSNEMEDSSLELQPYLVTGKGILYDTGKREHLKGNRFSSDVPIAITQSFPESGLNKRRGKSVHLSSHEPEIQTLKSKAEKLLNAWTLEGLEADESDSTDVRKSAFLEANRNRMNYANCNQENLPETGHYGRYSACRRRQQTEEYVSRLPRDLQAGGKNYSGFCSPDTPLYSGPDSLELLKKINELKDELKRIRISDRFSGEPKHNPTIYHEAAAQVERVCSDYFRCTCRTKCNQVPRSAYMPRRGTCVCLHCLPQGYHYSGGLPIHNMCCNDQTHRLDQTCQSFNKGCRCSSSSRQLHSGHQFLHDHTIKSNNRMHRETEGVRRVRKRDSSSISYMRPTAGGSPLISCYHCSKLLKLPADFPLHGRRRSHVLKCNACRNVMTFSIQGGKHLVPCIPDAVTPPCSMIDDCNGSFDRIAMANGEPNNVRCSENSEDIRKGKHKELSPTSSAAALHRLMGYSSPSYVIGRRTTEEQ